MTWTKAYKEYSVGHPHIIASQGGNVEPLFRFAVQSKRPKYRTGGLCCSASELGLLLVTEARIDVCVKGTSQHGGTGM